MVEAINGEGIWSERKEESKRAEGVRATVELDPELWLGASLSVLRSVHW